MALAFDAVSSSSQGTDGSYASNTWSHTCSGSDRVLVVGLAIFGGQTGSTVTYAGTSMTRVGTFTQAGYDTVELWSLTAPATGANNIIATFSAAASQTECGAVSFTGGSGVVNNFTSQGNAALSDPSISVSSAVGNIVIDVVAAQSKLDTPVVGAGQTQRWNLNGVPNTRPGASSTEAGAASVTMSWTGCSTDNNAIAGANVVAGTQPILGDNFQMGADF